MNALLVSTELTGTVESHPEDVPRSPWVMLQERRAHLHRGFCVAAANKVIDELLGMGVDAVIFGSLASEPSVFRHNSDVDFCLLNRVVPLGEIEAVVRKNLGPVKYDLVEFDGVDHGVRQAVIANGVRRVQ